MSMFWKPALAAVIFIVLATIATNTFASEMKDIARSTVKLYSGDKGICSMTFLRNDDEGALFLTAAHCVDAPKLNFRKQVLDPKDLSTVFSEQIYYLKPVKTLKGKDIAILQVTDKEVSFAYPEVDFATVEEANSLNVGDPLFAIGYPAGQYLAITKGEFSGKVATLSSLGFTDPLYQTTVPVAGGNSGGALYAQFNGEWKLLGTTSAKRVDNDIMTYFTTTEVVQEALKGFDGKKVTSIPDDLKHDGSRTDDQ